MKKLGFVLVLAIFLAGSAVGALSVPSHAQGYAGYTYPPPPRNPYATPWVGPNTPWIYYNGDWFLNGVLYHFFGPKYGWAPYYAYTPIYIVRPIEWYGPRWRVWYQGHPHYRDNFVRKYPYWRKHRQGRHYDQSFYNKHHRGRGGGWQKGFHGRVIERPPPEERRPPIHRVGPPERQRPGPARVAPPERRRPGPAPAGGKKAPAGKPGKTGLGEKKH